MGSRRVLAVLGTAAAAMVVTACGASDADEAAPTTTTTAPVTTAAPTTTAVPTTTTTVTTAPPTTTTAPPTTTYRRNEAVYFTAPAGGFQCGIIELATRTEAGCQGTTTPVPPRPENCMVNWGSGIRVTGTGPAEFLCSGGLVYTSGGTDPVLPVGQTVASFGFTCVSAADGITCRKDDTGHGFRISSNSNETF
ncbi:DUF6636 domain-containing protein [Rhodococcus sp. NPDC003322]